MLRSVPTPAECASAVRRAADQCAAAYRQPHPTLTAASIAERVTGIAGHPIEDHDDWWCVGIIDDAIGDQLIDVLYRPRRLAMRQRRTDAISIEEPSYGRIYNDGRGGWRNTQTDEPATQDEIRRDLGVMKPMT